jgi:hypothetical protein
MSLEKEIGVSIGGLKPTKETFCLYFKLNWCYNQDYQLFLNKEKFYNKLRTYVVWA